MQLSCIFEKKIKNVPICLLTNHLLIHGIYFHCFSHLQVGEDDQKLAEGISLYSIATESREKPAILGELIKVNMDQICITFVPLQLKSIRSGI
jgi:hypothetical protein